MQGKSRKENMITRLFREAHADLQGFLTIRLSRQQDVEDIAQEAYLRVFSASSGTAIRDPRGYLFRTAGNLLIDRARRERRRPPYQELIADLAVAERDGDLGAKQPTPEYLLSARQELDTVLAAIDGLSPQCRRVFTLHKIKQLSYAEIARDLNLSKSTVEKHMMKAIRHLRENLP